ncbi:hypothetical protein [Luteipulveratus mongoliensis]|uniref:Spore-associated protein A n=1 Tax=Luteipulveratus mongoliensis TaxID=571913 RepID=A0A0K1JKM8_9MICO|nr:hypothetical protein [Luteipulveratus mongoliensis]AKU17256.1 hypothetical protein VV02_17695 [Luteipulveratus mongoliensis]
MNKKLLASTLAGAALASTGALAMSSGADAAPGAVRYSIVSQCKGSIVESGPLRNLYERKHGEWQLWYSSANNGTNCLMVFDRATGSHQMDAGLAIKGAPGFGKEDSGTFSSYAGGIQATNTNNRCVWIQGSVTYPGSMGGLHGVLLSKSGAVRNSKWIHCG